MRFLLLHLRYYVGFIASVYYVAQFISSFFWGRMSDRFGRRPILLFGAIGQLLSSLGKKKKERKKKHKELFVKVLEGSKRVITVFFFCFFFVLSMYLKKKLQKFPKME